MLVFEILLAYEEYKDWKKAFYMAIPPRKVVVKHDNKLLIQDSGGLEDKTQDNGGLEDKTQDNGGVEDKTQDNGGVEDKTQEIKDNTRVEEDNRVLSQDKKTETSL